MTRVRWASVIAAALLAAGAVVGLMGAAQHNWFRVAFAAIVTLVGIGIAVLSLHER